MALGSRRQIFQVDRQPAAVTGTEYLPSCWTRSKPFLWRLAELRTSLRNRWSAAPSRALLQGLNLAGAEGPGIAKLIEVQDAADDQHPIDREQVTDLLSPGKTVTSMRPVRSSRTREAMRPRWVLPWRTDTTRPATVRLSRSPRPLGGGDEFIEAGAHEGI